MNDSQLFPALFAPADWGIPVSAQFELRAELPPVELIANINVVPFVGDHCLIIQVAQRDWDIPGGTLEPDEHYIDAARRELLEEAGARLIDFHPFGAWDCYSLIEQPYRAHLPHPRFYRVAAYGEVELVGKPLNPPDAEQVTSVDIVAVDEAARRFRSIGRGDLADLYLVAALLRAKNNQTNS